jgi:hypothetical protein
MLLQASLSSELPQKRALEGRPPVTLFLHPLVRETDTVWSARHAGGVAAADYVWGAIYGVHDAEVASGNQARVTGFVTLRPANQLVCGCCCCFCCCCLCLSPTLLSLPTL